MLSGRNPGNSLDDGLRAAGDGSSSPKTSLLIAIAQQAHGTIVPAAMCEQSFAQQHQFRAPPGQEQPSILRLVFFCDTAQGRGGVIDRICSDGVDKNVLSQCRAK